VETAQLFAMVGVGLLGLVMVLVFVSLLAALLFADRARSLGYRVERNCSPLALSVIGWPATFNLLDSETRLSHKDRARRFLYLTVAWGNRITLVALGLAILSAIIGFSLAR
jgi:hypothetical protein